MPVNDNARSVRKRARAFSHLPGDLGAHGAVLVEGGGLHTELLDLHLIGVRDDAAE
jgi:hypothetical protein